MKQTKFFPPIEERDTNELIGIANCKTDYWQEEAKKQAAIELKKRGISVEYQNKVLKKWENQFEEYEKKWEVQKQKNASANYSIIQLLIIFILAPLILLGKIQYDQSISELKEENFLKKVSQRRFMLITGAFAFLTTIYVLTKIEI